VGLHLGGDELMTTYPSPSDPRSAMTRADGTTVRHSFDHGSVIDRELNGKYFGMKGNGSDDTAAFQDALDAVLRPTSDHFAKTLVIPWTDSAYEFGALNWYEDERAASTPTERWITIRIEGKLRPQTTITIPPRRLHIVGGSGAPYVQFSNNRMTEIDGSDLGTDPVITFTTDGATALRLEGFQVTNFLGNGLLTPGTGGGAGNQAFIYLDRMWFQQDDNATGDYSPVKVSPAAQDNFNYHITNSGSAVTSDTGYAFELWDAGLVLVENCVITTRGLFVGGDLSNSAGRMTVRNVLAENLENAFLTIDSTNGIVEGIYLELCENADSAQSPSCLIKNTGTQTERVWAFGCGGYTRLVESGSDEIPSLYQNAGATTTGTTIGQTSNYMNVDRGGRYHFATPISFPPLTKTDDAASFTSGENTFYILTNANPTTVTNFTNEIAGQFLILLFGNGNTTIQDNADISLRGNANFTGTTGDTMVLISDGTTWYEISRATERGAYTQTYSTADKTHAAPTAATLTVSDGAGTNDNTIGAITADASVIAAVQELADEINKLVADVADVKQVVNSIIDDLQALGIVA
jgi:hypothetical protein